MGTDEISSQKKDSLNENDLNDVNEFYGIKSSSIIKDDSLNDEELNPSLSKKELFSEISENNALIPTTFEWDNGGNSVYLTGSFCQWKQFFLMKKDSENNYILTLNLIRGIHQYKFKVDGEWKCNPKFPFCNEGGFINNYIDTTKLEITIKNNEERTTAISTNLTDKYDDISKRSRKSSKTVLKLSSDSLQTQRLSKKENEFNEKITRAPSNYKNLINIDLISKQNNMGRKKYLQIIEQNILSDNLSFKNINIVPIEYNNHLYSKIKESKNIICSFSSRYRRKHVTFVYYKPKNKNN